MGYKCSASEISERFYFIKKSAEHRLFVATDALRVVKGWIHVLQLTTLEMSISTELGGLAVDSSMRGQGIGRLLVEAAEKWSLECGISRLQFTSQVKRIGAHEF